MSKASRIRKLAASGACLALCLILPFFTGNIPQIGAALAPMHIPVLICGFICGWPYGLVVGFIAPLLRFALFSTPPMPIALAMAFEMAAYGAVSGLLYKLLPKKTLFLYAALILSMLCGRVVWGAAMYAVMTVNGGAFTWSLWVSGAFVNAVPGIIAHLLLVPLVVLGLRRAGFIKQEV